MTFSINELMNNKTRLLFLANCIAEALTLSSRPHSFLFLALNQKLLPCLPFIFVKLCHSCHNMHVDPCLGLVHSE